MFFLILGYCNTFVFCMKITFKLILLLLVCAGSVSAQYVNTDSLVVNPISDTPLIISHFDSLQYEEKLGNATLFAHFVLPGNGGSIISAYGPRSGRMHYGTDIKMEKGDTVIAAFEGRIIRAGYGSGFGNLIIVEHDNNLTTYYAHLSKFLVKIGDLINKGEAIGLAGSTGRARGNHLHFEIRENNLPFDPEMVFDFRNNEIRMDAWESESLADLHRKLKPVGYAKNVAVPEYYKVRSGDSLSVISRRYKTSVNQICQLNNISETSILQIGQVLTLY